MKLKKLGAYMTIIGFFMLFDFFAVYSILVEENFPIFIAIILGIVVASLMDIPPFFFSSLGYAVVLDNTCDEEQKKKGRIISVIGIIYTTVILGSFISLRIIMIRANMDNPDFNSLFSTVIFTVTPILTTLFSIALGFRSYVKNEVNLIEECRVAEEECNVATERHDGRFNDLSTRISAFETESDTANLMEAIRNNGEGVTIHIDALNRAALGEVKDRYRLDINKLSNILNETLHEALLNLDTSGTGIGVITGFEPTEDFKRKAASLKDPDENFEAMVDKQIKENQSRKRKSSARNEED